MGKQQISDEVRRKDWNDLDTKIKKFMSRKPTLKGLQYIMGLLAEWDHVHKGLLDDERDHLRGLRSAILDGTVENFVNYSAVTLDDFTQLLIAPIEQNILFCAKVINATQRKDLCPVDSFRSQLWEPILDANDKDRLIDWVKRNCGFSLEGRYKKRYYKQEHKKVCFCAFFLMTLFLCLLEPPEHCGLSVREVFDALISDKETRQYADADNVTLQRCVFVYICSVIAIRFRKLEAIDGTLYDHIRMEQNKRGIRNLNDSTNDSVSLTDFIDTVNFILKEFCQQAEESETTDMEIGIVTTAKFMVKKNNNSKNRQPDKDVS